MNLINVRKERWQQTTILEDFWQALLLLFLNLIETQWIGYSTQIFKTSSWSFTLQISLARNYLWQKNYRELCKIPWNQVERTCLPASAINSTWNLTSQMIKHKYL